MSPTRTASSSGSPLESLKPPPRGLILDVDGVLWKDSDPIGDLPGAFAAVRQRGLKLCIATNSAMKTVDDYVIKLRGFGVEAQRAEIVTSAEATADTLAVALPGGCRVFVVGERGLVSALEERGFDVNTEPDIDQDYAAVVGGIDRELSYAKVRKAAALARSGVPFYGTNPDATFPTPEGLVPGAGAILAAITTASGKQPTVVGKPSPLLFQMAAKRMGLTADDLLVVGDRLETDIAGGQAFGARTALVLTGVSTAEEARAWNPSPTLIVDSLNGLLGA